jgi:4-aminobutyrate aminotransferase-like enzyme
MKLIEESNFSVLVPQKGEYFLSRLRELQKRYSQIGDVDGIGLALRIEICEEDGFTPNKRLTDAITNIGLSGNLTTGGEKRGLVLDVGGYYKNVFTLAPSFTIQKDEIDLAVDLFEEALQKGIALTSHTGDKLIFIT